MIFAYSLQDAAPFADTDGSPETEGDSLETAINAFLRYMATERRLSPLTCKTYRGDLVRLMDFCRARHIGAWERLDTGHVRAFLGERRGHGKSPGNLQRLLSAVRSFYRFLEREGIVARNPTTGVAPPRQPRPLPQVLDVDQVAGLLDGGTGRTTGGISDGTAGGIEEGPLEVRDRAIMELFYSSGLRLAELVALDLPDLDRNEGLVRVLGKGNKVRIVPVGRAARQAVERWLRVRPELAGSEEQALFVSLRKTRISPRSIQARLQKWGKEMALHPHLFRHCFASHLLESSGDLRAVQELLGHADIGSTQIYTHLDFQHLASVYDKAHPRARKSSP